MELHHAVWVALEHPEARMAFTVHNPDMGHNYGIGSATVTAYATNRDGSQSVTVVDQVTADPATAREITFKLSDVVSWSFSLEAKGNRLD